jgi:hypothetical protein
MFGKTFLPLFLNTFHLVINNPKEEETRGDHETSRSVRPECINKWPNSMLARC